MPWGNPTGSTGREQDVMNARKGHLQPTLSGFRGVPLETHFESKARQPLKESVRPEFGPKFAVNGRKCKTNGLIFRYTPFQSV